MFLRLLLQSFLRQRRRKLLATLAVLMGTAIATTMLAVSTDIGDKMNRELRALGPNIVIFPQDAALSVNVGGISLQPAGRQVYLKESELPGLKRIFWAHNIVGFAPFLETSARMMNADVRIIGTYFDKTIPLPDDSFRTGVRKLYPWWSVRGEWPTDAGTQALVGHRLADTAGLKLGDSIAVGAEALTISGILDTGGSEEDAIIAPLALVQKALGAPDSVQRVVVSALTKPEDDFARRDPRTMSGKVLERWSCSPYANSIAYQIMQAIPGAHAEQIRQVAQTEGVLLSRISGLMLLVAIGAMLAAVLAVSSAMAAAVLERRHEIGIMKSLGASNGLVVMLFLAESSMIALGGGLTGFAAGTLLARRTGELVFGASVSLSPALLPAIVLVAFLITFLGSLTAVRRAVSLEPARVLRGGTA